MDKYITEIKQIIKQLTKANMRHEAILNTTSDGFWTFDLEGKLIEVNDAYSKMSGYTKEELLCLSIKDIEAIESPEETKKHIDHIMKYGNETFETIHIKKNGQHYPVEVTTSFSTIDGGCFFVLVRDITERKNSENKLLLSSKVFSTMSDGVLITNTNQQIVKVNDSFCKMTGFHRKELLGKNPNLLSSGWHEKEFYKKMWSEIYEKGSWQGELSDRKKNGETYIAQTSIVAIKDKYNTITNYIAISSDVTHKREQEEIINNLAYYDALTKLPNKVLFEERFNNHLTIAKRHHKKMALFFIDLDNFKNINDTLGHLVGDQFLKDAAVRMKSTIRAEDTIGRFGGDEFAILVHDITSIKGLGSLAQKIVNIFKKPFILNDSEVFSGASIGISIYPDDGKDYVEMTRLADTAMYHVKHRGKNGYEFFSNSMNESIAKKMQIENALYGALDNDEFYLTYQPKVNIETNKVYGLEALIRWVHPTLGFIGPDEFIPIAEENGQIYNIGLWVLKEAIKDLKKLHNLGFNELIISINVSNKQIEKSNFLEDFIEVIDTLEVEKKFIDLEITESQIMGNIESSLKILSDINKMGISFSIDDFGTGYSSLSYLKKLPFQTIKIDKSFVLDIDKNEDDKIIVSSIIALAKAFNKDVIAEGSETQEHIDILKTLGVNQIQGYFYSQPLKFQELKKFIEKF